MKTFFVAILSFALGVGAYYGWNEYQKLKEENGELKMKISKVSTSPTEEPTASQQTPAVTGTSTTATASAKGSASGTLGYPAEGIPSLVVYAINTENKTKFYFTETSQNETTFTIDDISPGTYYFVAYQKANPSNAGGYTKAVPCGLLFSCKDHSLIPVAITAGKKVSDIQIKDWYADDGAFPAKPN